MVSGEWWSMEAREMREVWNSALALMVAASALLRRARKGASRGEGERVREWRSSCVHF